MSSFNLCPVLKQQPLDNNGNLLIGGKIYSYVSGTSTPLATFTDATGEAENTNPVVLDGAGRANVWLGPGVYKFVVEDADGNVIYTVDNVSAQSNGSAIGGQTTFDLLDDQSAYQNIPGLIIDKTVNQCTLVEYTIIRTDGTNYRREHGFLTLLYDPQHGLSVTREGQGTDALNMGADGIGISSDGQGQYKSDSMGGTYAGKMTWQINTAFSAEGI